ncbi:MAG: hypothetical protein OXF07_02315 [Rhodobacter sp.]|nr:hypothetical protein [Rhodobacter sp.]MCY4166773.1 hypothetical protein [Rhodobacter sp.]
MTTGTFDTLTAARELEAAGVERRQAEAHALRTAIESTRSDLATRAVLAALEIRLVKWGIGLALGVAGVTAAVVLAGVRLMLGGAI